MGVSRGVESAFARDLPSPHLWEVKGVNCKIQLGENAHPKVVSFFF